MKEENMSEMKQSFIAEARREQIIGAAIKTLDEIGFVKASLAEIAKRAGISTALISYHFTDKSDLMDHLLMKLLESSSSYILEKVHRANSPREKIHAFITASLAYQGTHPEHNTALLEIIFNARTQENIPYYKLNDDEDEPLRHELEQILQTGKEQGVFGEFNTVVMSSLIQGAIGEYMLDSSAAKKLDLEMYSEELIKIIDRLLKTGEEDDGG